MSSIVGKPTDGLVSRYLNRRLSHPITKFILRHKIPLTPNQVSFIAFLLGAFALPAYIAALPITAGVLVQLCSIIDGVDGELARALGKTSHYGAFFDAVLDRLADLLIIIGAALYVIWYDSHPYTLPVVATALGGSLLVSYLHIRGQHDLRIHPVRVGRIPSIASRDVRLFVIFIGSVLGFVWEALLAVALLSLTYFTAKFVEVCILLRGSA